MDKLLKEEAEKQGFVFDKKPKKKVQKDKPKSSEEKFREHVPSSRVNPGKSKGWKSHGNVDQKNELTLDLLTMRSATYPKRFYKAPDKHGQPKYFEMGTVVDLLTDFYSARIPKKQRKKSTMDELLADAEFRKYIKRKYTEIQQAKMEGTRPYKKVKRLKRLKKKKQ